MAEHEAWCVFSTTNKPFVISTTSERDAWKMGAWILKHERAVMEEMGITVRRVRIVEVDNGQ